MAREYGVELKRAIEVTTRGNSVFAFDLPGQVAPAAQSLWQELTFAIDDPRVGIWPFDGLLPELAERAAIVAAEIYPRAAYGTALSADLPALPRSLAKTQLQVREASLAALVDSAWVRDEGVVLDELALALASEDDFDALMTAAALLRLTLTNQPLSRFAVDQVAEGAILAV